MKRDIIRTDGSYKAEEVGDGFETWNKAIGASIGELVVCPGGKLELWCDEEGLCIQDPVVNVIASRLACRPIVGDVIVFQRGDVK